MTHEEEMLMDYHTKKWEEEQRAKNLERAKRLGMTDKITWSAPFRQRFIVVEEKKGGSNNGDE